MSNSKSCGSESISDSWIKIIPIIGTKSIGQGKQAKTSHVSWSQNNWQPLIVNDMLPFSIDDPARFFKQFVIIPIRIEFGQLSGNPIMFCPDEKLLESSIQLYLMF